MPFSFLKCPDDMVRLDGMEVDLGKEDRKFPWEGPLRRVKLPAFCIDKYEYPNKAGQYPLGNVSWSTAQRLCRERGRRLCTSDEWERACRGQSGNSFSYGASLDPDRCSTPFQGQDGGSANSLAPSGSYEHCKSAEGVHDLNGNLSEWVSDKWAAEIFGPPEGHWVTVPLEARGTPNEMRTPLSAPIETFRILRGGTMWSETHYGQSCHSRHAHPKDASSADDGFRCCSS